METNCGNKIFVFKALFAIFAVVLTEEKVDKGSPKANNQEWSDVGPSPEKGAWVPAEEGNPPLGPIGGWDDDIDRGFLPGGNLGPDDDPKQWKIEDSIPGIPGQSYPNYAEVPDTTFDCQSQKDPGYYGDVEARCQVFHICQMDGRQNAFLCPIGTIFDQKTLVCDWWFNVNCAETPNYYFVNSNLYKEGGSINSEWSARKGDTFGNWGNVAQPIPDGAVSWTMRDNLDSSSRGRNIPMKGNWPGRGATNSNKGTDSLSIWNRQSGFGVSMLGGGRSRNLFEGIRSDGHMKGVSVSRSRRFHGNRRRRIMQNHKGGSQRWGESVWPASNEKGNINFGEEHRNMKGGFSMMHSISHRKNEWDSSRNLNPPNDENILDASWTGGKGSAFEERGDSKGYLGGAQQVSWTNTVSHDVENWNKGSNEIYSRLPNDGQGKFPNFQIQGRISNALSKGQDSRWNGISHRMRDNLQWDDNYYSQRRPDYYY